MPAGQARADAASHVTVDACTPYPWAVGRGPWAVATARHWANLPTDPNREPVALSPSPARSNRRAPPVVATRARMCAVSPSSRLSIYAPVPSVPPSRGSDSFQCAVAVAIPVLGAARRATGGRREILWRLGRGGCSCSCYRGFTATREVLCYCFFYFKQKLLFRIVPHFRVL